MIGVSKKKNAFFYFVIQRIVRNIFQVDLKKKQKKRNDLLTPDNLKADFDIVSVRAA